MDEIVSQEEAIYALATARGISHELIYKCFEKMVDQISDTYPTIGRDDWRQRLAKAEQCVWSKFFPDMPYPGKTENSSTKATPETNSAVDRVPAMSVKFELQTSHESFGSVEPLGERAVNIGPQPSPIQNPITRSQPLVGYASQVKLITSKAVDLGIHLGDCRVFQEKYQIAMARFPGESPAWQTWFGESLIWSFYFKDIPFPGLEPARIYPLRSSTNECAVRKRAGSLSSEDDKWVKFSDEGLFPKKVATGANMIDSYRPSNSVVRTTTDRAIPRSLDSYRPERLITPPKPIPTTFPSRSTDVHNSTTNRSAFDHPATSNQNPSNHPTRLRNSSTNSSAGTNPLGYSSGSAKWNDTGLNCSTGMTNPISPSAPSISLEKMMEKKARSRGKRREFFQFLQKMRDQVRGEHPNCSSEYRHYAADKFVWAKFFDEDPFPTPVPRGPGHHAWGCSMYASSTHSQALRLPERLSVPLPPLSNNSLTSSERPSQTLKPSERLSASYPPPSNNSLTSSERLSIPNRVAESLTSELTSQSLTIAPRDLVLALSRKRLTAQPNISKETRALMVNHRIIWTTATSVKRVADSFSTIDATMLDLVENELKCHFRSYHTSTGDVILWNEAFLTDDIASSDRGGKFLDGWFDLAFRTEKAQFSNYWEQFRESEEIGTESANSCGSPLILVNGKFFKSSFVKLQEVIGLFYHDKHGLHGLQSGCQFTYSFRTPDHKMFELRAYVSKRTLDDPNQMNDSLSTKDKETSKRGNEFLEAWVRDVLFSGTISVVPSEYFSTYIRYRTKARIIIKGTSQVVVECRNTLSQTYQANYKISQNVDFIKLQEQLKLDIRVGKADDADGVESLLVHICARCSSDISNVDSAERAFAMATSWAVTVAKDPEYFSEDPRYSLLTHLQKSILIPSSPVNDPIPANQDAPEKDWAKYATTFKASELDRLMIEEAAKVEASLRMVLDKSSGQVIGLEEYGRRIRAENNRSPKVNDCQQRVVNLDHLAEDNRSPELIYSEEQTSKRKLEEDKDGEQAEKRTRV